MFALVKLRVLAGLRTECYPSMVFVCEVQELDSHWTPLEGVVGCGGVSCLRYVGMLGLFVLHVGGCVSVTYGHSRFVGYRVA